MLLLDQGKKMVGYYLATVFFMACLTSVSLGVDCSSDDPETCGKTYPHSFCKYESVQRYCPRMCRQCTDRVNCSRPIPATCGRDYPQELCNYTTVEQLCPWMCGLCVKPEAPEPDYIVEVFVLADAKVVQNYVDLGYEDAHKEAEEDIYFAMNEVNKYYSTLKASGLAIEVRMRKLEMLTSDDVIYSAQTVKSSNASLFLEDFWRWLDSTKIFDTIGYDAAILLTGHDMGGTSGRASKIGGVCTRNESYSVSQFFGSQSGAKTIGHEIAHSLGAWHDVNHGCTPYPKYEWYMTPFFLEQYGTQRWFFSFCSAKFISDTISALDASGIDCLKNTTTKRSSLDVTKHYNRAIMNSTEICYRFLKTRDLLFCTGPPDWTPLAEPMKYDVSTECRSLDCGKKSDGFCQNFMATEGMICGVGKRCDRGKCLAAPGTFGAEP